MQGGQEEGLREDGFENKCQFAGKLTIWDGDEETD
jgi:hypothetical protein